MFHGLVAQEVVTVVELFTARWIGADVKCLCDDVWCRTGWRFAGILEQAQRKLSSKQNKREVCCIVTKQNHHQKHTK